jgi:CheY-like chemotaxis protein
MTAYALKGDRERCLEHGMNDYIAKPIDKKGLIKMLGKWLLKMPDYRKSFDERFVELRQQGKPPLEAAKLASEQSSQVSLVMADRVLPAAAEAVDTVETAQWTDKPRLLAAKTDSPRHSMLDMVNAAEPADGLQPTAVAVATFQTTQPRADEPSALAPPTSSQPSVVGSITSATLADQTSGQYGAAEFNESQSPALPTVNHLQLAVEEAKEAQLAADTSKQNGGFAAEVNQPAPIVKPVIIGQGSLVGWQ